MNNFIEPNNPFINCDKLEQYINKAKKKRPKVTFPEKNFKRPVDDNTHTLQNQQKLNLFYKELEASFRGKTEDIKARLQGYLNDIIKANAGTKNRTIIDLGCGRGEWLELLSERNLEAIGIEHNPLIVNELQLPSIPIIQQDIMTYLSDLSSCSVGAVTGFHILEHFDFEDIFSIIEESFRILMPGGIIIFETPNPANSIVANHTFHYDPTHKKIVPPELMTFLVQFHQYINIRIIGKNPYPDSYHLPDKEDKAGQLINHFFYGPQDYAIIAEKGKEP